ncbi:MAG: enhanced intracellular survival protein Eis [Acidimicrobiales bacterium]
MIEIRPPTDADRAAIAAVGALAFNMEARADQVAFDNRRRLCAYAGERVVAIAHSIPFGQWLGGKQVPCAGIGAVAVLPEYRGQGLARALMGELLARERHAGVAVSALYPANSELYRQLGYEYAGLHPGFRAPVADVPPARADVSEMAGADLDGVISCFSCFAAAHNGPVQPTDRARWEPDVLAHAGEGTHQRTVVVRGPEGEVAGYASYFLQNTGDNGYRVACKHLVALSAPALSALLGYFRRFENGAREIAWFGPPTGGSVALALATNTFALQPTLNRWMARILDVPRALEGRGYPAVSGEVVVELRDPLFPDNAGPWLVRADGGQVTVTPAPGASSSPARAMPIGLFSALYTGFATVGDLVLIGALDGTDPRLPVLSTLFSGPVPWMPDFF